MPSRKHWMVNWCRNSSGTSSQASRAIFSTSAPYSCRDSLEPCKHTFNWLWYTCFKYLLPYFSSSAYTIVSYFFCASFGMFWRISTALPRSANMRGVAFCSFVNPLFCAAASNCLLYTDQEISPSNIGGIFRWVQGLSELLRGLNSSLNNL
uniref:Uncharacterized protein LOC114326237 n=1 Tax=Diabrotica virgifera virgifera TaxID=50390 RepID=A0A6P7F681_DIAVI